jgi:hypothetical protein
MEDFSMKKLTKYIILTILLSSFIIGLTFISRDIRADIDDNNEYDIELNLYYATYGDYDNDGVEDDCYFEAKLYLRNIRQAKSCWFLTIELPSGYTFEFKFYCSIDSSDGVVDITIYAFNTAIESGWYIGTLYCYLYGFANFYIGTYDKIIFDPPSGSGEGDPRIEFLIG